MDLKTIKLASGFCLEITVFTAMATLDMEFVSTYIVPVLIYTVILAVLTVPIIFYLAYRFCREEWFEKACMAFGAATGNTSTGLALVRAVDPDSLSSAGDTHGVYSAIMSWKDVFVGPHPHLADQRHRPHLRRRLCHDVRICSLWLHFLRTKKQTDCRITFVHTLPHNYRKQPSGGSFPSRTAAFHYFLWISGFSGSSRHFPALSWQWL